MSAPDDDRSFRASTSLGDQDYLRERLAPSAADPLYLHLSDLKLALERVLPPASSRILDFGCGGSPYRPLFRTDCYHRADIAGAPDLDYVFGPDSRISAPAGNYDCVLSTQVLEHVQDVAAYLGECRRVLRRGGTLLLSTHGAFVEHGCPHDFWRWTADGLRVALEGHGFTVTQLYKLTTGPRALLFLNQQLHHKLVGTELSFAAASLRLSRLVYTRLKRSWLNNLADREYGGCRVVPAGTPHHELYVGLLALASPAP